MLKRQMDLTLSVVAIFLLSPLILGVVGLLYLIQGRPILFTQPRVGLKGKIFRLYKFRTMRPLKAGENPHGMDRLTPVGKIIRSLSLDELPSLLNVIRGEMSLVGPRPLLVQYLNRYSKEQMRRHDVLPGLTGWAQVNGRNTLSWDAKFRYDVDYVDNASIWFDFKIIYLTFKVLMIREGINSSETDVMDEFNPGLYVMGCGGHAKVVLSILEAMDYKVTGVFDDNPATHGKKVLGIPVLGSLEDSKKFNVKKAVIGIGSCEVRRKIANEFNYNWISVVHPSAMIHGTVSLGKGTVICAGAIIQADSSIGEHSIINTGAIVEHDCTVENFVHLCPGTVLAGGVKVEESGTLGIGVKVIPGKCIGKHSVLGAGSVVIEDIPEYSTAVGVPAKVVKTTISHIRKKA